MKLTNIAIKRRVFTTMIYFAIMILGFTGLSRLSIDFFPELEFPMVIIMTQNTGVGPQEIETSITKVIEGAVASAEGIDKLLGTSKEGLSVVTVQFKWGTDLEAATADLRDKLDRVRDFIPDSATKPTIFRINTSNIPVIMLGLRGNQPLHELYDLADMKLKDQIEQVKGVASMLIQGARKKEVHVLLDRNRLDAFGLTPQEVINVLRTENINASGGNIKRGYTQYTIRTVGEFKNIDQMRNIILAYRRGVPVFLKYVATVKEGISEKVSTFQINGKHGLRLIVYKQSGENSVAVVKRLKKRLKRIKPMLPKGVEIITAWDTAEFISQSINSVSSSGVLGAILAVFIVLIFLRNIRASIIIGIAIPMSVIATFIAMYFSGVTLNIVSLGGLALGIGMLVDNAIIVLENTFNYLKKGNKPAEAARLGSQEIAMAIFSSTLTTVCVFLPIVFTEGLAKEIFMEMALTVSFSLLASLFVSLTLVPMLSARFLRTHAENKNDNKNSRFKAIGSWIGVKLEWLDGKYKNGLTWVLKNKKIVIIGVIAFFAFTMGIISQGLDTEFMPEVDQGMLRISLEMPAGTRLEKTVEAVEQINKIVLKTIPKKYIAARFFLAGGAGGFAAIFNPTGPNVATFRLRLISRSKRPVGLLTYMEQLKKKVVKAKAPLGVASVKFSTQDGGAMMGGGAPIDILVRGFDLKKGAKLANQIKKIMESDKRLYNINVSRKEGVPEMVIRINRKKAAFHGINMRSITSAVQQSMLGEVATYFRKDGREIDILVRLKEKDRKTMDDIENIQVMSMYTRKPIRLGNIARLVTDVGPVSIERDNQERVIHVTCSKKESAGLRKVVVDLQQKIAGNLSIPSGFSLEYSGSFKDMQETFFDLFIAIIVAILLVFAVMASIFESFLDPFIILFTIPLSIIGVIWMLFITGTSLNVNSFIGILVLAGVVVNNGIVLVDYINILRERGRSLEEAIVEGGRRRLRPILMTTLTTILAMTPLAIGMGEGSESSSPLARSVIGGLSISTLLSLFFIPVLYAGFERLAGQFKMAVQYIFNKAKQTLAGNWENTTLFIFTFMGITTGLGFILNTLATVLMKKLIPMGVPIVAIIIPFSILSLCLFLPLLYGYMYYFRKQAQRKNPGLSAMFEGFRSFKKVMMLNIAYSFAIFIRMLLFIIPGIVATYTYSFSFFVLMDNPNISARDALRKSKDLIMGERGIIFSLQFILGIISFGLFILSIIAGLVLSASVALNAILGGIVILAINLILSPLFNIAVVLLYQDQKNPLLERFQKGEE